TGYHFSSLGLSGLTQTQLHSTKILNGLDEWLEIDNCIRMIPFAFFLFYYFLNFFTNSLENRDCDLNFGTPSEGYGCGTLEYDQKVFCFSYSMFVFQNLLSNDN